VKAASTAGPVASSADVVVIGGGIVGCASAYHLARRGVRVLLLDKGRIGHEQSSRNMGAVRQQARDPVETPLMIECVRLWETLSRELDADIEWVQGGNLGLAATPEELERFERAERLGRALGLDSRLLSADEVKAAIPRMASAWRGGLYTPTDGHASAPKTTRAFADAARRHGAVIEEYRAVEGVELAAGRVATVLTDRGPVRTGQVVCAAGAHSARLVRTIGLDLPIRLVRSTVAETGPLPTITRAHVWGDGFVIRQVPSGRVQLNFHSSRAGEYDLTLDALRHLRLFLPVFLGNRTLLRVRVGWPLLQDLGRRLPWSSARRRPFAHTVDVEPPSNSDTAERCRQTFLRHFPSLGAVKVERTWAGVIDCTPDLLPAFGPVAARPGFFFATGFSGHGFAMAPLIGRLVGEWLVEGKPSFDVTPLRFARFAEGDLRVPENLI
jgi:glycine/D-amino acid oxidase-like deaminating enzyme